MHILSTNPLLLILWRRLFFVVLAIINDSNQFESSPHYVGVDNLYWVMLVQICLLFQGSCKFHWHIRNVFYVEGLFSTNMFQTCLFFTNNRILINFYNRQFNDLDTSLSRDMNVIFRLEFLNTQNGFVATISKLNWYKVLPNVCLLVVPVFLIFLLLPCCATLNKKCSRKYYAPETWLYAVWFQSVFLPVLLVIKGFDQLLALIWDKCHKVLPVCHEGLNPLSNHSWWLHVFASSSNQQTNRANCSCLPDILVVCHL